MPRFSPTTKVAAMAVAINAAANKGSINVRGSFNQPPGSRTHSPAAPMFATCIAGNLNGSRVYRRPDLAAMQANVRLCVAVDIGPFDTVFQSCDQIDGGRR